MSTDKLQAIHDTVTEILSEPPSSPHTYFDEEPHDAAPASERVATASDYLQRATQIPTGNFGKATSSELGISSNETRNEQLVRDAANESSGMARQALAEKIRHPSDRQISSTSTRRPAASGSPGSFR